MLKRWFSIAVVALVVGVTGGLPVRADSSDDKAIASAPAGVSFTQILAPGSLTQNGAAVVTAKRGPVLVLTTGSHEVGTAWSPADQAFDLTRNQTLGAWVYQGSSAPTSADNLAFVLQNDPRGRAANPQQGTTEQRSPFGKLAVAPDQAAASQLGIQNSWALGLVSTLGQWQHVTLTWDAAAQTMTETVNDRDVQTGAIQPGDRRNVPIDLTQLDPHHTGQARWGFTAATGSAVMDNLVVLTQAPGLAAANVDATLTDLTQQRPVTRQTPVVSHDRIQVAYRLTYQAGRRALTAVSGHLVLPSDIDYDSGRIDYANGQTATLNPQNIRAHRLTVRLTHALTRQNPTATIRLRGQVRTVPTTQSIARTTSTFVASSVATTATTPAFDVAPHAALKLAVTSADPVTLMDKQATTIQGTVHGAAATAAVTVKPTLNGKALPALSVTRDGTFRLALTADQLQAGNNYLQLVAATATGATSATVTVPITVGGRLQFLWAPIYGSFQRSVLTGRDQFVHRTSDWQIAVQDTRGTGQHWSLDAQATPLENAAGKIVAGGPVYVDSGGTTPLGTTLTQIMTHTTDDSVADGVTNVTAGWSADTGILLNVPGGTPAGTYHSTLTLTLTNAPS